MTVENWHTLPEPQLIKTLNNRLAKDLAYISPGNCNKWLSASAFLLVPIHVKHMSKDISKESIRDFWASKSNSRVKS